MARLRWDRVKRSPFGYEQAVYSRRQAREASDWDPGSTVKVETFRAVVTDEGRLRTLGVEADRRPDYTQPQPRMSRSRRWPEVLRERRFGPEERRTHDQPPAALAPGEYRGVVTWKYDGPDYGPAFPYKNQIDGRPVPLEEAARDMGAFISVKTPSTPLLRETPLRPKK